LTPQAVVPCKFRTAKQLVSHNIHSSTYNYKYTFSVEIVPVCKVRAPQTLPLIASLHLTVNTPANASSEHER
jgi:NMD protein affecting ribosome stability and mRNA decay